MRSAAVNCPSRSICINLPKRNVICEKWEKVVFPPIFKAFFSFGKLKYYLNLPKRKVLCENRGKVTFSHFSELSFLFDKLIQIDRLGQFTAAHILMMISEVSYTPSETCWSCESILQIHSNIGADIDSTRKSNLIIYRFTKPTAIEFPIPSLPECFLAFGTITKTFFKHPMAR